MKSITKNAKELLKRRDLLNYEIDDDILKLFKNELEKYRKAIINSENEKESEEHCKGIFKDLLVNSFGYNCNTKGKIDLVIKYDDVVKTIIETKNYDNEKEMIKDNDYFHKSFYQIILYYYRSRQTNENKNFNIDNIIITDYKDVYLFLKDDFENIINDKQIINYFKNNSKIKNETFYNICGGFLKKINIDIVGYKINLFEDDIDVIHRFFNSYNICSVKLGNDINSISNTFYKEIIYMMGLEEDKEKKLRLSNIDNSLVKLTMDIVRDSFDYNSENDIFESALKFNILWINRILFLKILEAQIRVFRNDNNLYILNPYQIKDYNYLYTLFFKVLARPKHIRASQNREDEFYKYIPYLNSSLFEEGEDEKICTITKLNNESKMKIMSGSILYRDRDFHEKELTFLEYILRFLNCYVFNADAKNVDKNTIIKSSVLGLVFERLNGYKDGSHFTPPAITMYMAKYSIEKIIVEKFNKYFKDTHFNNIGEVKKYSKINIHIYENDIRGILDSIKIIDPACGSGHFLVACLNELIRIKSEFKVLHDDIDVSIDDDELVINYINGIAYKYNIENDIITDKKQEIEKILFEAKKHIINNQLYGVDINPNSVNICRLRLWIELLKSSYYMDIDKDSSNRYIDLEILPNLEFKIVSANSLIELEEKESNMLLQSWDKNELIKNMRDYFNASYDNKKEIRKEILNLIKEYSNHNIKLENYNPFDMLKSYDFFDSGLMFGVDKFDLVIMNPPYFQLTGNHQYLDYFDKKDRKATDIYQLFMEMTFNKLIDDSGIVSAVISNKWMRAGYGDRTRKFLYDKAHVFEVIDLGANWFESATVSTNIICYGKKKNNDCDYMIKSYIINLTEDINKDKNNINEKYFINSKEYDDAWFISTPIENSIYIKIKKSGKLLKDWDIIMYRGILTGYNDAFIIDEDTKSRLLKNDIKSQEIISPIIRGRDLKPYSIEFDNKYLIATYPAKNVNIDNYPAVKKYLESFGKRLEQSGEKGSRKKTNNKWFELQDTTAYYKEFEKEKIFCKAIGFNLAFSIGEPNLVISAPSSFFVSKKNKYFVGILNSSLIRYFIYNYSDKTGAGDIMLNVQSLEKIPIPEPDKDTESKLVGLVDSIIQLKKENKDTSEIEGEVDKIVYSLYGLSDEEIKIIEG